MLDKQKGLSTFGTLVEELPADTPGFAPVAADA